MDSQTRKMPRLNQWSVHTKHSLYTSPQQGIKCPWTGKFLKARSGIIPCCYMGDSKQLDRKSLLSLIFELSSSFKTHHGASFPATTFGNCVLDKVEESTSFWTIEVSGVWIMCTFVCECTCVFTGVEAHGRSQECS